MKYLGKALSWIFIAILAFIAGIIVWLFIQTQIYPDKIPSIFGYKPFIVMESSMDVIQDGDLIIVKEVDPKTLKKNDIISFRDVQNYVVTNKIVEVTNANGEVNFITRGDNYEGNDIEIVRERDLEGIYDFKIAGAGKILLIMQEPATLVFVLAIIFGGGALYIVYSNELAERHQQKQEESHNEQDDIEVL